MYPHVIAQALVPLVLGAVTLHAQPVISPDAQSDSAALPGRVVEVEAGEFFFRAPDTLSAGLTTFRMRQIGLVHHRVLAGGAARDSLASDRGDQTRGFHMLWLVRLDSGKTATDFHRAVQAGEPTPWARSVGGPGFAMPPRTSNATLILEPGSYVLTCFVGSAREDRTRYHLLNGMFRALTVLPTREAVAKAPVADVIVRISESGSVDYSTPILAGRRVLRVENARARPYEFTIRRVLPGRTPEEALAWRQQDAPTTRPPFVQWGGISDVPAGGSMITTIDFEPGVYFVGTGATGRVPFTVLPTR